MQSPARSPLPPCCLHWPPGRATKALPCSSDPWQQLSARPPASEPLWPRKDVSMTPQIAAAAPHGLLRKTHIGSWLSPCSNAMQKIPFSMGCLRFTKPCWLDGWLPAWGGPLGHATLPGGQGDWGPRLNSLPIHPHHGTGSPYSNVLGNIIGSSLSPLTKSRESFVFSPGCIKSLFPYSYHYFFFTLCTFRCGCPHKICQTTLGYCLDAAGICSAAGSTGATARLVCEGHGSPGPACPGRASTCSHR